MPGTARGAPEINLGEVLRGTCSGIAAWMLDRSGMLASPHLLRMVLGGGPNAGGPIMTRVLVVLGALTGLLCGCSGSSAPAGTASGGARGSGGASGNADSGVDAQGGRPDEPAVPLRPKVSIDPARSPTPHKASPCSWIGTGGVQDVRYAMQGTMIITSGPSGVRIYDAATGVPRHVLPSSGDVGTKIRLSADSSRAAYLIFESVGVWNVVDGSLVNSFDSLNVVNVDLSPDGKTLALGLMNGGVTVWDVDQRTPIANFMAHTSKVRSLLFSPDGKALATSDGGAIRFWSTKGYDLLFESPAPTSESDYRDLAASRPTGSIWSRRPAGSSAPATARSSSSRMARTARPSSRASPRTAPISSS